MCFRRRYPKTSETMPGTGLCLTIICLWLLMCSNCVFIMFYITRSDLRHQFPETGRIEAQPGHVLGSIVFVVAAVFLLSVWDCFKICIVCGLLCCFLSIYVYVVCAARCTMHGMSTYRHATVMHWPTAGPMPPWGT